MKVKNKGLILAAAAAAILASGTVTTAFAKDAEKGTVKCDGGNACSGKSACKTPKNDCAGKNTCKSKGVSLEKSAEDCKKAGGTVIEK